MSAAEAIRKSAKKVVDFAKEIVFPSDIFDVDPDALTKSQIKLLSERKTISKLLFYRSYTETKDGYSFYIQADGRIGIIFQLNPPPYLSVEDQADIVSLLNTIMHDNTIVHIVSFASRNIKNFVAAYEKLHSQAKGIKHPELLKHYTEETIKYLKKWTWESVAGKESDLRVRNFKNLLSVLFPYDTDEFVIKQLYNQIKGILKEYGAKELPASEFVPIMREILNPSRNDYDKSNDTITNLNKQITRDAVIRLNDKKDIWSLATDGKQRFL